MSWTFLVSAMWMGAGSQAQPPSPPTADFTIRGAGPHTQDVELHWPVCDSGGVWHVRTNRFTKIETGLNYFSDRGFWEPSGVEIHPLPGGGAAAVQGQHQVFFSGQLHVAETIRLHLPDGRSLKSHVHGLAYTDSNNGQSVLIAEVQDSEAWLYPPNQVMYPNAFSRIGADVRYTYSKAGFEQDIILREGPPAPEQFGLSSATTELEVWTEFIHPPEPHRRSSTRSDDGQEDEELDFDSMRLGNGRTFTLGDENDGLALVSKRWVAVGQRRFLVEAVPFAAVAATLRTLPPARGGAAVGRRSRSRLEALQVLPQPAEQPDRAERPIRPMPSKMMASIARRPGWVLDYSALNTTLTNFVFQSDSTYLISGPVNLSGTNTTFEGGAVIKFANTNSPRIAVNTPVNWQAGSYRPVVLTASDDSSVGETLSTNAPVGFYADTGLDLEAGTAGTVFNLANLRIAYARKAVVLNQNSGHTLSHVQLINCQNGINPNSADFSLRNALFVNVSTNFNGSASTGRVEHLTVDGASWLNANNTFGPGNLQITNSLLVGIGNLGTYSGTAVAILGSGAGIFQSIGGGNHYLAMGSGYRDVGVSGISPALARDFKQFTTYPPITKTGTVSANLTLTPVAQRDADAPDLGYHYPALDYYFASPLAVTSATLTLADGVALGFSGISPIWLQQGSSLVGVGYAQQLNVLTRYSAVQESGAPGAPAPTANDDFFNCYNPSVPFSSAPKVDLRFTALNMTSPGGYALYADYSTFFLSSVRLRDCQIYGGSSTLTADSGTNASSTLIALNNNLFVRSSFLLSGLVQFSFYNQLAVNSAFYLLPGSTNNNWVARDNIFDTTEVLIDNPSGFAYSNNGYVRTNGLDQMLPLSATDIILPSFNYASPTYGFGPWYHVQTNFVNAGSRTADQAGLYQETTRPNQVKEGSSIVDLGFHYVAADSNGNPVDTDSDGFADYLEDSNGNGNVDSGETAWNLAGDMGFRVWITQPRSNSPFP